MRMNEVKKDEDNTTTTNCNTTTYYNLTTDCTTHAEETERESKAGEEAVREFSRQDITLP
jgi:hypothetical protein